jgi:hypothetical protein
VGGVVFDVTLILEVDIQPLLPVTVTVYVPGEVIDAFALFPKPPLQEYVAPPVAVTLIDVLLQVNTVVPVLLVIPAVGVVVFDVTVILEVDVQPLLPVTVTV